jgi:serine/threonine protein phosphatase PrpC
MGMDVKLDVDYQRVELEPGDVFLLTTDGVHGSLPAERMAELIAGAGGDLETCCERLLAVSLEAGSTDNVTCQLVRIDALPAAEAVEVVQRLESLPLGRRRCRWA